MTVDEIKKHGNKYSQTFKKGYGVWKDDFDAMAKKTVMKLLIARYAPMSVELNRAVISDQAVLKDIEEPEYIDNQLVDDADINKINRIIKSIENCKTLEELDVIADDTAELDNDSIFETLENKRELLKTK